MQPEWQCNNQLDCRHNRDNCREEDNALDKEADHVSIFTQVARR
jgi:hypothetical protein